MRRATTFAAFLLVAALALVGCGTSGDPTPPPGQDGGSIAANQQATAAPLDGYFVTVPKLNLTGAPLVPLGLDADHTIQVPPLNQPQELGVYSKGPMPGAVGPSIILGHVNSGGVDGAFAHLADLKAGDEVDSTAPGGVVTKFVVYRTATVEKSAFPTSAVYSDTPGPELRLITCGGELDTTRHNYVSNVVVWAHKA